jgi:hypothetical protein
MRSDMEHFGHRHLVALSLDRGGDEAQIVAEMTLDDGTLLVERYGVWTYDRPLSLDDPDHPREAAFMIAIGISNL